MCGSECNLRTCKKESKELYWFSADLIQNFDNVRKQLGPDKNYQTCFIFFCS